MTLYIRKLYGAEARPYFESLVALKLLTFAPFPFLYTGNLETERAWLETYFCSSNSFIMLLEYNDHVVGACTGICGKDEEQNYRQPFLERGMNPDRIFFFGESMLLPEFRALGYGQIFYEEREKYALSLPEIEMSAACLLERPIVAPFASPDFARRKERYEKIWRDRGFKPVPGLLAQSHWCDQGSDVPTPKSYQIWLKDLAPGSKRLATA